eukprot:3941018-Rhodomonas_salina.8
MFNHITACCATDDGRILTASQGIALCPRYVMSGTDLALAPSEIKTGNDSFFLRSHTKLRSTNCTGFKCTECFCIGLFGAYQDNCLRVWVLHDAPRKNQVGPTCLRAVQY